MVVGSNPTGPASIFEEDDMTARIAIVSDVRRHGDTLTIVTVQDGDQVREVVANLQDDGTPRWSVGEPVVYVAEGSIVPEDLLRTRGYWNEDKGIGLLEGKKGNRVKMRRFAGFESRGLLFKTRRTSPMGESLIIVDREVGSGDDVTTNPDGVHALTVTIGDDVTGFLGITEHAG